MRGAFWLDKHNRTNMSCFISLIKKDALHDFLPGTLRLTPKTTCASGKPFRYSTPLSNRIRLFPDQRRGNPKAPVFGPAICTRFGDQLQGLNAGDINANVNFSILKLD